MDCFTQWLRNISVYKRIVIHCKGFPKRQKTGLKWNALKVRQKTRKDYKMLVTFRKKTLLKSVKTYKKRKLKNRGWAITLTPKKKTKCSIILVSSLLVTNHEQRRQRNGRFADSVRIDDQEEQSNEVKGIATKKQHSQGAWKAFQPTRRRKTEAEISSTRVYQDVFLLADIFEQLRACQEDHPKGEGRTSTNHSAPSMTNAISWRMATPRGHEDVQVWKRIKKQDERRSNVEIRTDKRTHQSGHVWIINKQSKPLKLRKGIASNGVRLHQMKEICTGLHGESEQQTETTWQCEWTKQAS